MSEGLWIAVSVLSLMMAGYVSLTRDMPARGLLSVFWVLFAVQAGLMVAHQVAPVRWGLSPRAVVAAVLPPLLYLFFRCSGSLRPGWRGTYGLHFLPALAVLSMQLWPAIEPAGGTDVTIIAIEAGYALALLALNRRPGPGLRLRRQAVALSSLFLLVLALLDVYIMTDVGRGVSAARSPALTIAVGLMVALCCALYVALWRNPEWLSQLGETLQQAVPRKEAVEPSADAEQLCRRLDAHIGRHQDFREFGIGLTELARRLGVTGRQLSQAINRVHGRGFRTWLNDRRVEAAAVMLRDPDQRDRSIIDIMFDAGFQTKSSFNKEFARRLGLSPSDYRNEPRSLRTSP